MSVLNGREFLRPAVESVLAQTFGDFEFIIIDNASTDDTQQILDAYRDARIVRVRNAQVCSLTQSLNKGLRIARGDYVARLDADDVARPTRLARQVEFLESNPDVLLVGSHVTIIDENDATISQFTPPTDPAELYDALAYSNPFAHSAIMVRKPAVLALGGYPEAYVYAQDFALWLKLAQRGNLGMIRDPLTLWREHRKQATNSAELAITRHGEVIKLFEAAQQLPGLSATARRKGRAHIAGLHCLLAASLLSAGKLGPAAGELLHGVALSPVACAKRAFAAGRRSMSPRMQA